MNKYLLLLSGLLVLSACKKDDEAPLEPITFDGTTYTIKEAKVIDYGAYEGYYNYDIYMTDGSLDSQNMPNSDASLFIYAELYTPGDAFKTGTFVIGGDKVAERAYLGAAMVAVDSNGDGSITEADQIISASSGEVRVEGAKPDFQLTYKLELVDGSSLKGTYNGELAYKITR